MDNELEAGSQRTGLLVDGVEETPYVVATLSHELPGRIRATVPFLQEESSQFASAKDWFDLNGGRLPANLVFEDERGAVSLYGTRTHFASIGNRISVGKFAPEDVVFARSTISLEEELKVRAYRSKIDGLTEWLGGRAIRIESQSDNEGRLTRIDVSAQSPADIEWTQGDARMTLAVHWHWSGQRDLKIEEYALLHSQFVGRKGTPQEHLKQHRVVRALLTILSGEAVYYREHWVKDEQFPLQMLSGRVADIPWQRAYHQHTLEEHHKVAPPNPRTSRVMARFDQIGTTGLASWADIYDRWRRPIDVLVALLERQGGFIEEHVLSACMAIESAGHLIGQIEGEPTYRGRNIPFANQVFRCLRTVGFNATSIATSDNDLAAAAADVYRRIKHPEHEMPDSLHSWLMSQVLTLVARLTIVKQVNAVEELGEAFMNSASRALADVFENNGLRIGARGVFEETPSAGL